MLLRRITIPTDRDGEPVGAQIKAILDSDSQYQVAVVGLSERFEASTDLIVPILPSSLKAAEGLLSNLRRWNSGIPLLPIVRSETLNRIESLCSWSNDFLLTPLRELEVRTRVHRLLRAGTRLTDPT